MGKLLTAAAITLSMASTPVLAQAASPASKLSVANAMKASRSGATLDNASQARGGSVLLGVGAVLLVGLAIYFISDSDDDPVSP